MPLKLSLKGNERLIVGGAVVRSGPKGAVLFIENNVTILREKSVLSEMEANTPCKRAYFTIQLMYIDAENSPKYETSYWEQAKEIVRAAPSTAPLLEEISERIQEKNYYQALRTARDLIDYEEELLKNVH